MGPPHGFYQVAFSDCAQPGDLFAVVLTEQRVAPCRLPDNHAATVDVVENFDTLQDLTARRMQLVGQAELTEAAPDSKGPKMSGE